MCDENRSDDGSRDGRSLVNEPDDVFEDGGRDAVSVIFDCLRDARRRYILYYLQEEETASVETLATEIVALERGISPDTVTSEQRERVVADLVHNHLPRMAEGYFIEYDRRSEVVRYTELPTLLEEVMQLLAQFETE